MTAIVKSIAATSRKQAGARVTACAAAVALAGLAAACSKSGTGPDEMGWARAALARNQRLEIVAVDRDARTFTVRLKGSSELRVVHLDEIVAGPAAPLDNSTATPAAANVPAAAAATAPPGSEAAPQASSEAAPPAAETSESGATAQNGAATAGQAAEAGAEVASDGKGGRVLASGPGFSIKAGSAKAAAPRVTGPTSVVAGAAVERRHDPIICQGARLLHIDNRNLAFDGDAVSAEDGCEIHITNSRITAKGVGVLARAANVHIANSEIEGDSGAIDASDGAQIYAESSTFKGLTRHLDTSSFHDLGGNAWN
jgi:hypothetical protein